MEAHCTQFTATTGQELKCRVVRTILTPETGKEKGKRQAKIKDKVDGGQSKICPKRLMRRPVLDGIGGTNYK